MVKDNNWPRKKLGEVILKIGDGGTPSTSVGEYFNGDIPWVNIEDIKKDIWETKRHLTSLGLKNSSAKLWPCNTIIFSFGASIGKVGIAKVSLCTKQGIAGIIANDKIINYEFLYYSLVRESGKIKSLAQGMGSTLKEIRPSKLTKLVMISLPPLSTQQKIVCILDTIQKAINLQEEIIEKTKELKKSIMADLFKYGGPSFRKGRKLKKTEIGEIPEDWETIYLSDKKLFELQTGLWAGKKGSLMAVKVIRNTDFEDGKLIFDNVSEIEVEVEQFRKRDLRKDDILIEKSGGGPKQPVGRVAFINNNLPNYSFSNFLSRIRVITDKIFPAFIFRYLDYFYQKGGTFNLQERTTGIRNLRFKDYINQPIPFPSLPEQREIAEILQTIDQKIEIEQKKKALYEELFRTMLNKLMTGEIRVDNLKL